MRPDVTRVDERRDEERMIGDAAEVARSGAVARTASSLIMIVDDSLTVRKITSRMLTRAGFDVDHGEGRRRRAASSSTNTMPDVILLDIEMPRMDGFEFTKTIKGEPEDAPTFRSS